MITNPASGWRQRTSGMVASAITRGLARINLGTAKTFGRWWARQHILHPSWFGSLPARMMVRTKVGWINCDLRDSVQAQLLTAGEWEPAVSETIKRILRPGDVFIDV